MNWKHPGQTRNENALGITCDCNEIKPRTELNRVGQLNSKLTKSSVEWPVQSGAKYISIRFVG